MNGDWEMPFSGAKYEFGNAFPPGDQSPGYVREPPPEGGLGPARAVTGANTTLLRRLRARAASARSASATLFAQAQPASAGFHLR